MTYRPGQLVRIRARLRADRAGYVDHVTRTQVVLRTGERFSLKTGRLLGVGVSTTRTEPWDTRKGAEERIVAQLAERMRAKLAQRRHHGDWREMAASTVMDALRGEVEELRLAFFGCCDPEDIIAEAVDVAAYAAILVDVLSMEAQ